MTQNSPSSSSNTLNRLMTPPPPLLSTDTSTSSTSLTGFTSKFYGDTLVPPSKDHRYANNYHTGDSNTFFDKSHHLHTLNKDNPKSNKRYAMSYHTGSSGSDFSNRQDLETSTSSSTTPITGTGGGTTTNNYFNTNLQNTHLGKGSFTSASSIGANTHKNSNLQHINHLHNIKQQLLHNTGFSNNFPQTQSHHHHHHPINIHTNHLGTGTSNIQNSKHNGISASLTSSSNVGAVAISPGMGVGTATVVSTGFGGPAVQSQQFPTTASATVGASISFSQNSAQYNNNQQYNTNQQTTQNNHNWQQYNNNAADPRSYNQQQNQQVNNFQQNNNQQQTAHSFPTGFDPKSQNKLPWATNRYPTQPQAYRPPTGVAAGTAPSGGQVPFAHHHFNPPNRYIHHQQNQQQYTSQGTTGAATGIGVTAVRPDPSQVLPVTQSPISPTFGFGTTGNQYAAVRDPSQMPTEGVRVTPPSVPPPPPPPPPQQQQTPPPLPKSTTSKQTATTTLSTTTRRIEKMQDTTEPIGSASEASINKYVVESSTSRAGYGWGPEGASSGGNEEGVI